MLGCVLLLAACLGLLFGIVLSVAWLSPSVRESTGIAGIVLRLIGCTASIPWLWLWAGLEAGLVHNVWLVGTTRVQAEFVQLIEEQGNDPPTLSWYVSNEYPALQAIGPGTISVHKDAAFLNRGGGFFHYGYWCQIDRVRRRVILSYYTEDGAKEFAVGPLPSNSRPKD